tara:strand:+ start:1728 stop:1907 length:180 start_codon:yes stop_codon:yes gene_type:complete
MHKHPTPIKIQNAILIEILEAAIKHHISPTTTIKIIDALEKGIQRANREHKELEEVLNV